MSTITPESIRQQRPGLFPAEGRGGLYNDPRPLFGQPLSGRESEVLAALGEGLPNKLIAFKLGLTEGTVKTYLNRMFQKTGATSRIELALSVLRKENALLKLDLKVALRDAA